MLIQLIGQRAFLQSTDRATSAAIRQSEQDAEISSGHSCCVTIPKTTGALVA